MSDFVRRALRDLSGNHFKLWACLLEYRQSLTLEQFAEAANLDLATVKRLLKPDKEGKFCIVGDTYISVARDQRPHRYSLASQLQLRFEDQPVKVAFRNFHDDPKVADCNSKVAFCDSLYLESPGGIESILDTESDRSTRVAKRHFQHPKWRPDNEEQWMESIAAHARQTAQAVGDRQESFQWHLALWTHVKRTDAIHKTRLEAQIVTLALELKGERERSGNSQGAAFNARKKKLLMREGFPFGRKEKPDDLENVAVQPAQLNFTGDTAAAPNPADCGSDQERERRHTAAG